jgi:hypothetical protein
MSQRFSSVRQQRTGIGMSSRMSFAALWPRIRLSSCKIGRQLDTKSNDIEPSGPATTHEMCSRRDSVSWNSWKTPWAHEWASSHLPSNQNVSLFKLRALASKRSKQCSQPKSLYSKGVTRCYMAVSHNSATNQTSIADPAVVKPVSVISSISFESGEQQHITSGCQTIKSSPKFLTGTVEGSTKSLSCAPSHCICRPLKRTVSTGRPGTRSHKRK